MADSFVAGGLTTEAADIIADADTWLLHTTQSPLATGFGLTLAGCLAAESTFPGYAPQTLTWVAGAISGQTIPIVSAPLSFVATGPSGESVSNYFITDSASLVLIANGTPVGAGGPPYDMTLPGSTLQLTITEGLAAV